MTWGYAAEKKNKTKERKQVLCSPAYVTASSILPDTLETTAKVKKLSCDSVRESLAQSKQNYTILGKSRDAEHAFISTRL